MDGEEFMAHVFWTYTKLVHNFPLQICQHAINSHSMLYPVPSACLRTWTLWNERAGVVELLIFFMITNRSILSWNSTAQAIAFLSSEHSSTLLHELGYRVVRSVWKLQIKITIDINYSMMFSHSLKINKMLLSINHDFFFVFLVAFFSLSWATNAVIYIHQSITRKFNYAKMNP